MEQIITDDHYPDTDSTGNIRVPDKSNSREIAL